MVTTFVIALVALALALGAEHLHLRRCRAVEALAFGPTRSPRRWVRAVPYGRALAVAMLAWGYTALLWVKPLEGGERGFPEEKVRHVIFVLDVSPSMEGIVDSGRAMREEVERISRASRAKEIAGNLMNRMVHEQIRFSLLAFYTEARPVVVDCPDPALVLEMMDRPLSNAFQPGATDLVTGVALACEVAREWRPESATLVLVSDGDTIGNEAMPALPDSIGRVLVIGVGDPQRATEIHEHPSRQDRVELTRISRRLGGQYHDGNLVDLPDRLLGDLTVPRPVLRVVVWTPREFAILAVVVGTVVLALLPLALEAFGESSNYIKARERIA